MLILCHWSQIICVDTCFLSCESQSDAVCFHFVVWKELNLWNHYTWPELALLASYFGRWVSVLVTVKLCLAAFYLSVTVTSLIYLLLKSFKFWSICYDPCNNFTTTELERVAQFYALHAHVNILPCNPCNELYFDPNKSIATTHQSFIDFVACVCKIFIVHDFERLAG